jgi:hypothetical protein
MMPMINISCPNCSTDLQIDDGFRGGVCRCFDCGTLMTVPDDPTAQTPEPLVRQGAGSGQGTGRKGRSPAAPKLKSKQAPVPPPAQAGSYQTASGKKIELSEEQADEIPTADRRKVIRWATRIGVVLLCVGLLVGVGVGAYYAFTTGKFEKKEKKTITTKDAQKGVIYENPFKNPEPNFLGQKVSEKTVLCVDASISMGSDVIPGVTDAVRACAQSLKDNQQLQAIFWKDTGPIVFPDSLTAAAHINHTDMKQTFNDINASGAQKPAKAIELAMASGADQLTLVIGRNVDPRLSSEMLQKLSSWSKILSVVVVSDRLSEQDEVLTGLKEAVTKSGGEFRIISGKDIELWVEDWTDKNAAE